MNSNVQTASLWDSYVPDLQHYDEFLAPDGTTRPHWQFLRDQLENAGPSRLAESAATMKEMVRENGTTFRLEQSDGEKSRPWQVSPVPMLIGSSQWNTLSTGLIERTHLLETILQDFMGPQRLIREGIIPCRILWENQSFYRAYHQLDGQRQKLHLTATNLARRSDGNWIVTGDRTRAPSGLGYLLENRIVTSRVFPQLIRHCKALRCASFFQSLREHLKSLATSNRDNPRVALLTPPGDSYRAFEDAYLSRYLRFVLVQGSDLAVRGGALNMKTLGGLQPLQVLWRHVSDRRCDPLELDPDSTEGISGLIRCIRRQQVAVVNALGSVVVQTPALLPYLNAANSFFFGRPLSLASAETYWCGEESARQFVVDHLDELILRPAFVVSGGAPHVPSEMTSEKKSALIDQINDRPHHFVAQKRFEYSRTPVWDGNKISAQCVSLRTFQLLTGDSSVGAREVHVLPGALARVGKDDLELAWSTVSGNLTQDCWVLSETPVEPPSSPWKEQSGPLEIRRGGDELPSRVAEHLYWLGCYSERAEGLARLLRTTMMRISGEDGIDDQSEIPQLVYALAALGQIEPAIAVDSFIPTLPELEELLPDSIADLEQAGGILRTMESVMHNATAVRERLSTDAFRILQRALRELKVPVGRGNIGQAIERMGTLIADLLAFAGIVSESFVRTHAWQFMEIGRRIERAELTSELVLNLLCPTVDDGAEVQEAILQITDSLMTYRSRYLNLVRLAPVIDLVVVDETNPRSIRYQLDQLVQLVDGLPADADEIRPGPDDHLGIELRDRVSMVNPNQLCVLTAAGELGELRALMEHVKETLPKLSQAIAAKYLIHTQATQQITEL